MSDEVEVYGRILYSHLRQKCLEEGNFQKDQEERCIQAGLKTEKSLIKQDIRTMRTQVNNIKKQLQDSEKINLDYLDSTIHDVGKIASKHHVKYDTAKSRNIEGVITHLSNLSDEWRNRDKSKLPVETFRRDADTLTKLLDSYLEE